MAKLKIFKEIEYSFKWFDKGWHDWDYTEYLLQGEVKRFACCDKTSFDEKAIELIQREQSILDYYEKCRAELTAMKNHQIEGTSVTYYDILKKPMDVLMTSYVSYPQIIEEFKSKTYKPRYPLYHKWLRIRFDEATAYRRATEHGDIGSFRRFFQKIITNQYDRRVGKENPLFVMQLLAKYEAEINKLIFSEKELLCALTGNTIPEDEILQYYRDRRDEQGVNLIFDYYKRCQDELTAMKIQKCGNDSFFDVLLKKPTDLLTDHVNNGQFEIKDKGEQTNWYPIIYSVCGSWFDERV